MYMFRTDHNTASIRWLFASIALALVGARCAQGCCRVCGRGALVIDEVHCAMHAHRHAAQRGVTFLEGAAVCAKLRSRPLQCLLRSGSRVAELPDTGDANRSGSGAAELPNTGGANRADRNKNNLTTSVPVSSRVRPYEFPCLTPAVPVSSHV